MTRHLKTSILAFLAAAILLNGSAGADDITVAEGNGADAYVQFNNPDEAKGATDNGRLRV